MNWFTENWGWLAAAAAIVAVIYVVTVASEKRKKRAEAARMLAAVGVMINVFEDIVTRTVGSNYGNADRKKIALGMVAVVIAERIPLDRLGSDRALFASVLAKSIAVLTEDHQIGGSRR